MTRQNLVTVLAVIIAIAAAGDNIRTKREAAAMLEAEPTELRVNGIRANPKQHDEVVEKLKTRIGLLQKCLDDHGLYGEQPVPDDGLQIPGVYPQLIYPGAGEQERGANK